MRVRPSGKAVSPRIDVGQTSKMLLCCGARTGFLAACVSAGVPLLRAPAWSLPLRNKMVMLVSQTYALIAIMIGRSYPRV